MSASIDITPELMAGFADEAPEYLTTLDEELLRFEEQVDAGTFSLENPDDYERMNSMFRAAHSLKGLSAALGFDKIRDVTHLMETLFDQVRMRQRALDSRICETLFTIFDKLRELIDELTNPVDKPVDIDDALTALNAILSVSPQAVKQAVPTSENEVAEATPEGEKKCADGETGDQDQLRVAVTFAGNDDDAEIQAYLIKRKLEENGVFVSCDPDLELLDGTRTLDQVCFTIPSSAAPEEIERLVAAYAVESVTVTREPATATAGMEPGAIALAGAVSGQLESGGQESVPTVSADRRDPSTSAGSSPSVSSEPARREKGAAASPAERAAPPSASSANQTIRVDLKRLDDLMNLAGELVVNRARLAQIGRRFESMFGGSDLDALVDDLSDRMSRMSVAASRLSEVDAKHPALDGLAESARACIDGLDALKSGIRRMSESRAATKDFSEAINGLTRVSDNIQKRVMATRMVAVGPLFHRFRRSVRDMARATNKEVELVLRGEHTELDKRIVDELADPLTHMVRNSVDHGLEAPEERVEAGKPRCGIVELRAYHRGRYICIEVRDDGRGISIDKVKEKVIERELATPAEVEAMSDRDLVQYVFAPGFSTATEVTDLSGRGMGMDIVVNRIQALSGTVEIDSTPGKGTCVVIKLPLTLAIVTALVTRIGEAVYALPLEFVSEIVTVPRSAVQTLQRVEVVRVRDRVIPITYLETVLGLRLDGSKTISRDGEQLSIVVLTNQESCMGLVVDELIGQEDIIIKSISDNFRSVFGVAGASIAGDGRISLILDIAAMFASFKDQDVERQPLEKAVVC